MYVMKTLKEETQKPQRWPECIQALKAVVNKFKTQDEEESAYDVITMFTNLSSSVSPSARRKWNGSKEY